MQVAATVPVDARLAEQFPQRPDLVSQVADAALEAMRDLAAERHRHVSAAPRMTELRETGLGIVELTFVADTESD